MFGLDIWIEGDNYCVYCGQRLPCYCEPNAELDAPEEEPDEQETLSDA